MFGYGVDAVGEGMEGVTDYVLNNSVQRMYDPNAPQITIGDMVNVLGKDATFSLLFGAVPRELGHQANRYAGATGVKGSNFPEQKSEMPSLQSDKNQQGNILSLGEAEELAFQAIHGPDKANSVVLGRYESNSKGSYEKVAEDRNSQYFQIAAEDWNKLKETYSVSELWKINERFLDIQIGSGRKFVLTHDPETYMGKDSFYSRELNYLAQNKYAFVKKGGLWYAVSG